MSPTPLDIRHGRWQDVLTPSVVGKACQFDVCGHARNGASNRGCALLFDAPYSKQTHASKSVDAKGRDVSGSTPKYDYLTPRDVRAFCVAWADFPGWMVSITDDVLAPVWRAYANRVGRYAFAPVSIQIPGMTVRRRGDGPSSWTLYAMASRPRTAEFAEWGTLPGGYHGPPGEDAAGGKGKPEWLLRALVRDYSRSGDLVVDPYTGWGSTLTAAIGLGRHAIGSEIDAATIAEAQRRASLGIQSDLFDVHQPTKAP